MTSSRFLLTLAAATLMVAAASARSNSMVAVAAQEQDMAKAKEITERVCLACHPMDKNVTAGRTPAAWKAVVGEMMGMGAQATDEEVTIIVDYLSKTYPPK